jgi:hypothetical protein
VIIIKLMISLAIEIVQHLLPTQDSSMTDVMTNTLGTAARGRCYQPPPIRKLWKHTSPHTVRLKLGDWRQP